MEANYQRLQTLNGVYGDVIIELSHLEVFGLINVLGVLCVMSLWEEDEDANDGGKGGEGVHKKVGIR